MEHDKREEIAGVKLTTPGRIYYQENSITKSDLAAYYERVAPRMLPLVNNRILSMVRCPSGLSVGQKFCEKHARNFPAAMKIVQITEKGGHKMPFACVNGLGSLVAGVQMGTLEFHIWGSRFDELEKPDRIVMDIDPGEEVTFAQVKEAAFEIRDKLMKSHGLNTVPLLTGGKGVHVIAPLMPDANWPQVTDFTHNIAKEMEKENPNKYISKSTKAKRKGLMFIDYLRNVRGATAISPYSTRAKKGAPVAAPVTWEELKNIEAADICNVQNMTERIKEKDPWEESYNWKQSIPSKEIEKMEN